MEESNPNSFANSFYDEYGNLKNKKESVIIPTRNTSSRRAFLTQGSHSLNQNHPVYSPDTQTQSTQVWSSPISQEENVQKKTIDRRFFLRVGGGLLASALTVGGLASVFSKEGTKAPIVKKPILPNKPASPTVAASVVTAEAQPTQAPSVVEQISFGSLSNERLPNRNNFQGLLPPNVEQNGESVRTSLPVTYINQWVNEENTEVVKNGGQNACVPACMSMFLGYYGKLKGLSKFDKTFNPNSVHDLQSLIYENRGQREKISEYLRDNSDRSGINGLIDIKANGSFGIINKGGLAFTPNADAYAECMGLKLRQLEKWKEGTIRENKEARTRNAYRVCEDFLKAGHPLMMVIKQPDLSEEYSGLLHRIVITGISKDINGNYKGVIAHDPYGNLAKPGFTKQWTGEFSGKSVLYDLNFFEYLEEISVVE